MTCKPNKLRNISGNILQSTISQQLFGEDQRIENKN